jgi:DNA polymerase delta subunit 2
VYFIGNQPQFDQDTLIGPDGQQVKVVLVPSFSETNTIVLVNVNTLECKTININVDMDEMME